MYKLAIVMLAMLLMAPRSYSQTGTGGDFFMINLFSPSHLLTSAFPVAMMVACPGSTQLPTTNTSWGYYQWQVDQLGVTTVFTSETGITTAPGLVQVSVNIPCPTTIHEIHGNFAYAVWQSGTCGEGSIIAQVLDQNGNAIAVANIVQFGKSSIDIPIKGTFATPLSVTSLEMQFYIPSCGSQTASWSIAMS
jgi:hypothetical protein